MKDKPDVLDSDLRSLGELLNSLSPNEKVTLNFYGGVSMDIKDAQFSVNQSVGGNNYGSINASGGNINSVNMVSQGDKEELINTINYLKTFIMSEEADKEEKESALDDLDTIQEQVTNDKPKGIKIKKAYEGVKAFICKIPTVVSTGTLVVTKVEELYSRLKPLIEN
ncbi:MAG: hypothetical protein Q8936_15145 [Bacillota bacterium]|nr:hypothetical protein [Bacillota bacterium]